MHKPAHLPYCSCKRVQHVFVGNKQMKGEKDGKIEKFSDNRFGPLMPTLVGEQLL